MNFKFRSNKSLHVLERQNLQYAILQEASFSHARAQVSEWDSILKISKTVEPMSTYQLSFTYHMLLKALCPLFPDTSFLHPSLKDYNQKCQSYTRFCG